VSRRRRYLQAHLAGAFDRVHPIVHGSAFPLKARPDVTSDESLLHSRRPRGGGM
jgi:hypothetical protein